MTARIGARRLVPTPPASWVAIGAAWLVVVLAQLTGTGEVLHHHALVERGPPFLVAAVLFVASWQVMVAGMMLPGTLPAIAAFRTAGRTRVTSGISMPSFVGAYFFVWSVFGVCCFVGDYVLHQVVASTSVAGCCWCSRRSRC